MSFFFFQNKLRALHAATGTLFFLSFFFVVFLVGGPGYPVVAPPEHFLLTPYGSETGDQKVVPSRKRDQQGQGGT